MRLTRIFALCVLTLTFLNSCEKKTSDNSQEAQVSPDKTKPGIVGVWSNISMTVKMSDPDSILEVPKGHWEDVLKIKPIITTFNEDGTYSSEYRTPDDKVFMTISDVWLVRNDSLIIYNEDYSTAYHFEIKNGEVIFKSYLDWDGDGEKNDYYSGRQERRE